MHLFNHKMISGSSSGKNWSEPISRIMCPEIKRERERERERKRERERPNRATWSRFRSKGFLLGSLPPATWKIHTQSFPPSLTVSIIYQASALKCKNYPQFRALIRITPSSLVTLSSQESGSVYKWLVEVWSLFSVFLS